MAADPWTRCPYPAPQYSEEDVQAYERLRILLRRAIREADPLLLGRVSTESARRAQRVLHHEEFDTLTGIAESTGAAGLQIAHSGNVAGILFARSESGIERRVHHCVRALDSNGIPVTRTFTTPS